jgi:dihydrofolate reductase
MARLVFGMNLSLDGYADHDRFAPDKALFAHWIDQVKGSAGAIYGRKLYEIMRYWDENQAGWGPAEQEFALAWRGLRKWVVSGVLREVGPNATLLDGDLRTAVAALKAHAAGEIDVGGPVLAQALGEMGLIDEYRLYYHPVVLGGGRPFFAGALPKLRLVGSDRIGPETVRLTYVPA